MATYNYNEKRKYVASFHSHKQANIQRIIPAVSSRTRERRRDTSFFTRPGCSSGYYTRTGARPSCTSTTHLHRNTDNERASERKYVDAKKINEPVKTTVKSGKERWVCPSTISSKDKGAFLAQHSKPKKKTMCRAGVHCDEKTGAYRECLEEHYTGDHEKLYALH
jgi:hypothetical protein